MPYLYPNRLWHFLRNEKTIYLTFDDGPIPEVTPWVLDELAKYNARGTFFCIGKNIVENPQIFNRLKQDGHSVGNHTYNHLNAKNSTNKTYLEEVEKTAELIDTASFLFRPPYGKLSLTKERKIKEKGYKIVMWDVLSGDYDSSISRKKCLSNVLKNTRNGSIIIFHDSLKAEKKLRFVLPKVLSYFSEKGFTFKAIP